MRRQWKAARLAILIMFVLMLAAGLLPSLGSVAAESKPAKSGPAVVVIPVKQSIESGLQSFLERAFAEAKEARAEHIILVVNTLGGEVESADKIGDLIRSSAIPTTAFIEGRAMSAGTYIALNANQIVMQPASVIGAAAVVDGSGKMIENAKVKSFWVERMVAAAELNGRNKDIAAAMVDPDAVVDLTEQIGKNKTAGQILSLTAEDALKVGYSEQTLASVDEVVKWLQLDGRDIIQIDPTPAEVAARWIVNSYVKTILLIVGIAGILIELLLPGFGVPGIVGGLAFALYFFGHYVAGFAGLESIVLFVLGLALIIIELFVPSFGILGIIGGVSLIAGVIFAANNPLSAFISLVVAIVIAIIIVVLIARTNKGRGVWNKFILKEKLTTEEGYVSAEEKTSLVGMKGKAITKLRPAGTIVIGDDRYDVVTSGEFIDIGKEVVVTKAEGTWIIVKEVPAD